MDWRRGFAAHKVEVATHREFADSLAEAHALKDVGDVFGRIVDWLALLQSVLDIDSKHNLTDRRHVVSVRSNVVMFLVQCQSTVGKGFRDARLHQDLKCDRASIVEGRHDELKQRMNTQKQ